MPTSHAPVPALLVSVERGSALADFLERPFKGMKLVLDIPEWIGSFTEDGMFNNVTGEESYRGERLKGRLRVPC